MIYLGTATASDGKARALWIDADAFEAMEPAAYNAAREAALWYPAKSDTKRTIGGRYELKAETKGERRSVWFGTARYIGQSAHPLIAAFQADDTRARDAEYRAKNEKRAKEPVYMRDMERTLETLKALPRRQALDIADAIHIELRRRILGA
jgi:hypothetical protein